MTPQEKEAFHQAREALIKPFRYKKPELPGKPKAFTFLATTDLIQVTVQVVKKGGDNNLHYHKNSDTVWMVIKGRAKFYGVSDKVIGEFGPMEGLTMPGGARYWFEKIGDEDLEILQMIANDVAKGRDTRINVEAHKDWMGDMAGLTNYESDGPARSSDPQD
jgi:mannose-6-phosphate isomerase-like protein (cupin superfamily)